MTERQVPHVTCLGCGCACDDILLTIRDNQIVRAERACPLGLAWFDDGRVPETARVDGRECGLDEALDASAALLRAAHGRVLVFLGADITCEAQRVTVEIADRLRAVVDSAVSEPAATGILAGQRRGRATCTLGELRNRADLLVFWGVDPDERYPRYRSRYTDREKRTVVSVSIGTDRGPPEADLHLSIGPEEESLALSALRAMLHGRALPGLSNLGLKHLAELLTGARYVAIVHDGEPGREDHPPERAEGLITLAQTLNGPTRAALSTLRAGGNRSGAEAVLTWQTGFPFAVDYSRGSPRYRPDRRGAELLAAGALEAALVVGNWTSVPATLHPGLGAIPSVVLGPRASRTPFPARVVIDTGIAGIHEAGTGYRMDDLPLPLQAPLAGPGSAISALKSLSACLADPALKAMK